MDSLPTCGYRIPGSGCTILNHLNLWPQADGFAIHKTQRSHAPRSAATIFFRAARQAGRKPPTTPMARANIADESAMFGERTKLNASSVNDPKLTVEMSKSCMKEAKNSPIA